MSEQNTIRIEDWAIVDGKRFNGNVYGHPSFPDGKLVWTSTIVGYDEDTNIFTTYSGSKYKLGKVRDDYEQAYPNAQERVMRHLSEYRAKSAAEVLG